MNIRPIETPHFAGRLYWVVNSVREILQVKDLQSLHQVNFPLTVRMQENPSGYDAEVLAFYGKKEAASFGQQGFGKCWNIYLLTSGDSWFNPQKNVWFDH